MHEPNNLENESSEPSFGRSLLFTKRRLTKVSSKCRIKERWFTSESSDTDDNSVIKENKVKFTEENIPKSAKLNSNCNQDTSTISSFQFDPNNIVETSHNPVSCRSYNLRSKKTFSNNSDNSDDSSGADDEMSDVAVGKLLVKGKCKKKRKPQSPRKSLLLKSIENKVLVGNVRSSNSKPKIRIQNRPLTYRQIYHGRNWTPVLEGQEESECDCGWVEYYNKRRLEEIVDVNDAEKKLMYMWNEHLDKYPGRCIVHLQNVLNNFISQHLQEILNQNLQQNLVGHICALNQTGLISQVVMFQCLIQMEELMRSCYLSVVREVIVDQRSRKVKDGLEKKEPFQTASEVNSLASVLSTLELDDKQFKEGNSDLQGQSEHLYPPMSKLTLRSR